MKVLFWTDGFWPLIGGVEIQSFNFVKGMQERGHNYMVLAQKFAHLQEEETYHDISIRRFDLHSIIPKRELKNLRPIQDYIEWTLKIFQPDIIHLNGCTGWNAFIFRLFRSLFSSPIVLTVHCLFFYGDGTNPLAEEISSMTDQICCVSNSVLRDMELLVPAAKNKLRLIYNGSSIDEIEPSPLCFSPPTLLLLGRLCLEKGFDTAIAAFSLLTKRGSSGSAIRLLIAGEGKHRPALENLVEKLDLTESVQFIGEVARDRVPSVINQATLVLVPSYLESFGLVAIEAMQMGRPVVASRIGGLKEIVSDGKTGFLVPPRDPTALCQSIQTLLEEPKRAAKMGAQGRKRALEKFSLRQNIVQYEDLYKELKGNPQ